jgi:lipopolysaccharide transport system permease protein
VLGAGWAVVQPVLTMVVFSVFFGRLGGLPSDGLPYPLFTYAGLLPWMLFAHVLTQSSQSIVNHQSLITKVYFPRLLIVLAPLGVGLVDFVLAFGVLLAIMLWYGLAPGPSLLLAPLCVALAALAAVATGVWLAALNVRYRDVRYTVPFLTSLWLFASPVAYPASLVPERWRWLYGLNPMAGRSKGSGGPCSVRAGRRRRWWRHRLASRCSCSSRVSAISPGSSTPSPISYESRVVPPLFAGRGHHRSR